MTRNASTPQVKKPLSRRAAMLRLGGVAVAAYVVPSMTVLSAAHASGASPASKATRPSPTSKPSPTSRPSPTSSPSPASQPSPASTPSTPSGPTTPTGPSPVSGPSRPDYSKIVDRDSCEAAGGRFDAGANTCTVRTR